MNVICFVNLFLNVCLILQCIHYAIRFNAVHEEMKNWSNEVVNECNCALGRYYAGYKSAVSEWFQKEMDAWLEKKSIEEYVDTVGVDINKNNEFEDESFAEMEESSC